MAQTPFQDGMDPARADKLRKIARQIVKVRDEVDSVKEGEKAALDTLDDEGVHKGAFKAVVKMMRWSSQEAQDFCRAFDLYREVLGINDQKDLFDEPKPEVAAKEKSEPREPVKARGRQRVPANTLN